MLNERPAELDKKFPISSKERRKKKKGILRLARLPWTPLNSKQSIVLNRWDDWDEGTRGSGKNMERK